MNDLTSCEHMSERVYVCVCVRVPDAWKACCVVNSTSLKHWAAGQQLVCDSFYWNYLFLITIESKFNLFHKPSVLQSFFFPVVCIAAEMNVRQLRDSEKYFFFY